MNFNQAQIQQGRMNAQSSEETPSSFGSINGSAETNPTKDLSKNPRRMAGQVGARALAMMNDPEEIQRTNTWMDQFGMSNQGMQWNQAKMQMSQPQPVM